MLLEFEVQETMYALELLVMQKVVTGQSIYKFWSKKKGLVDVFESYMTEKKVQLRLSTLRN